MHVVDITESVGRSQGSRHQLHRDSLTGVADRVSLMARLDQELAMSRLPGSKVAVLYAEVDDFHGVNDTYGYEVGDGVLVELAERLLGSVQNEDVVGRLSCSQFAIVCPGLAGWPAAVALIERLRRVVAEPIASPKGEIRVSLSLGAAFADLDDGRHERAAALLARADEQMSRHHPRLDGSAGLAARSPIDLR